VPTSRQVSSIDADLVSMRLVGLLADFSRGLALIETDDGAATLEAGQKWGEESVTHIDAQALRLAARDGSVRSMMLAEADQ
jgi:Tfp pilus assembly protein PilP